jgi:hypothetical protein
MKCQYFATRRPGRKRDSTHRSKSNNKNEVEGGIINVATPISPVEQGAWTAAIDSTTYPTLPESNDYLTPLDLDLTTPISGNASGAEYPSSSDVFGDLLVPLDPSLSSTLVEMGSEFDHLFTSPIEFLDLEALDSHSFSPGSRDIAQLLIPDEIDSDLVPGTFSIERPSVSKASSLSSNDFQPLPSRDASVGDASSNSNCVCLMQALDLMKTLSTTSTKPSAAPSALSISPYDTSTVFDLNNNNPLAQTVVMENKEAIETVSNVLQCSCVEDGYLLTLLSMIVLKMLGRYAVAARKRSCAAAAAAVEKCDKHSSFSTDHEGLGRTAAQLILGELHHMQRLVNQLSPRLNARESADSKPREAFGQEHPKGFFGQLPLISGSGTTMAPFSPTTLDQLEKDLRKALSSLSLEIINILRQS